MSDPRTKIIAYINVEECAWRIPRLSTPAAWSVPAPMPLFRGSQVLLCAYLRLSNPNDIYYPPTGATWYFGIDDVFTADHADLVTSANDQFNLAGDWSLLDVTGGNISVRADLTTDALKSSLGSASSKTMYAAIWMQPAGGKFTLLAHWEILVKNIAIDPTSVTQAVPQQLASLDYVDAAMADIATPAAGSYRLRNGLLELYNATTSKWHTVFIDGAANEEHITIGPGA